MHIVSYPPRNTKLFRHFKQKFPGIFDIFFYKKAKNHLRKKPKLYSKASNTMQIFSVMN